MDKHEIKIERVFKAPKMLVFKAWTEPELIKKWWGPREFSAPVINIDFRNGGKYLYAMQGPDDKIYWSAGRFVNIDAPNQIVLIDYFSDENGVKVNPSDYGMDPNFPEESEVIINFEEGEGVTKITIIYRLPDSPEIRKAMEKSRMEEGWNSSLDKLKELVEVPEEAEKDLE